MSKRSAEQALRDELAEAETGLERAKAKATAANAAVDQAVGRRKAADQAAKGAHERVERARRALEALIPLGVEEAGSDGAP